jgi:membrane protein
VASERSRSAPEEDDGDASYSVERDHGPRSRVVEEDGEEVLVVPAEGLALPRTRRALDFVRRVYEKAGEDNIFFLAGAISFNVLVAIVPLLLFAVGVTGIVLTDRFQDPSAVLIDLLIENIPAIGGDIDLVETVRTQFDTIVGSRTGLTVIGALLLVWFSTRLVGTLRTALREVFDVAQDRGIIGGKLFDARVVVTGGVLFVVNIGVTTAVTAVQNYGVDFLGLQGPALGLVERSVAFALSFLTIWLLFLGIYRFLPARWIPWRTALIAATFAAVSHELLKWAFGWYATSVADYRTTYGNLVTLAVLFLWIYYEAVVFVLGGEVAQVWTMRRARRVKTRSALFGKEPGAG